MKIIDFSKYPTPKRIRHHNSANVYHPFHPDTKFPESYPPLIESIDWNTIFSNSLPPNCLDIGCGMGKFLINHACQYLEQNILGLEVRQQPVDWINNVIENENIGNAHAFRYSLANGLPFISDNSIDSVYYFFPDPWFKQKHKKRRVFSLEFLNEINRVLKYGGKMYIQTDVDELQKYHIDILKKFLKFEFTMETENEWNFPKTDHELFCIKKKINYSRIIATKLI